MSRFSLAFGEVASNSCLPPISNSPILPDRRACYFEAAQSSIVLSTMQRNVSKRLQRSSRHPETMITNVNVSNHRVNILCRVRQTLRDPLQYYLFTNRNGTTLNISLGVENGNYGCNASARKIVRHCITRYGQQHCDYLLPRID
ncbi:hypothetical protein M0804_010707 [Polistes exclamans]|nr:hypothetical protein M0804_010707 [Polistes exclamans]